MRCESLFMLEIDLSLELCYVYYLLQLTNNSLSLSSRRRCNSYLSVLCGFIWRLSPSLCHSVCRLAHLIMLMSEWLPKNPQECSDQLELFVEYRYQNERIISAYSFADLRWVTGFAVSASSSPMTIRHSVPLTAVNTLGQIWPHQSHLVLSKRLDSLMLVISCDL